MFPSAFFEKQKCSPLQNTAVGCDSSWAQRMDKDDELNSCPWHRAARQEKFHTQSIPGEEKEMGWILIIF